MGTGSDIPLVVTSLNPHSGLPHQLRCFRQWQKLGFQALTVNVPAEAGMLENAGLDDKAILNIDSTASGMSLFGKPVPRINPVLKMMERQHDAKHYILTNADIYPAARSSAIVEFWEECGSALALTRQECQSLGAHRFQDRAAYRGGLDTFFMTREGLLRVNRKLAGLGAADRMAFGVPGWDFLLGAAVLSAGVGGSILDSGILLHRSHRPTYVDIEEFCHYTIDMKNMGAVTSIDTIRSAEQFSVRIRDECQKNAALTCKANSIYFSPVIGEVAGPEHAERANKILRELVSIAPAFEGAYHPSSLASLAQRLSEEPDAMFLAVDAFARSPSRLFQFTQTLMAIAFALRCRVASTLFRIRTDYPKGNQHARRLHMILKSHSSDSPEQRLWIAKLFGAELVDYGIFNAHLYNFLALNCENETERALLRYINTTIGSVRVAA